jgi:hypothetical protein
MLTRVLFALAIGVLVFAGIVKMTQGQSQASSSIASVASRKATLDKIDDKMYDQAKTCTSVFIPANDVFGAANPSSAITYDAVNGPVPGTNPSAHEVDMYCEDDQRHELFVAYYYNANAGTISVYTYTSRNAAQQAVGVAANPVTVYNGVTSMSASYLYASQVANVNPTVLNSYVAQGGVVQDKLANLGYPGVDGGNRLTVVRIAASATNGNLATTAELIPGTLPEARTVQTYYAPGHQPLSVLPGALLFQYGSANTQPFVAQDTNYIGTYTESDTCSGLATIGGGGNGPSANFSATINPSLETPAVCEVTIGVADGSVPAQMVQLTLSPPGALSVNPGALSFGNPHSAAQAVVVNEARYIGGPFTADTSTNRTSDGTPACGAHVSVAPASMTADVNGNATATITPVSTITTGCVVHFADNHGGSAFVYVVVGNAPGPLAVNPTSLNYVQPTSGAQNITITDPNFTGSFTLGDNCGGAVSYNPNGAGGASATVTISPVAPNGGCQITVGDGYNPPVSVHISVGNPIGPLTLNPTSLTFAAHTAPAQNFQISDPNFTGTFTMADNCGGAVTYNGGSGSSATIAVTPHSVNLGCQISVSDGYSTAYEGIVIQDPVIPPTTPPPYPVQKYEIFDGTYACASDDPFCNNGEQFFPVGQVAVLLSNGDVFTNLSDIEQPASTTLFAQLVQCVAHGTSVLYSSGTPYSGGWTAGIPLSGYETQFDNGNGGNVNQFPQTPACDPTSLNCSSYLTYSYYLVGAFDWIGYMNSTFTQANGWYSQAYQLQNCN